MARYLAWSCGTVVGSWQGTLLVPGYCGGNAALVFSNETVHCGVFCIGCQSWLLKYIRCGDSTFYPDNMNNENAVKSE